MIKGSFEIWEFVVLLSTFLIFVMGFVLSNFAGIGSPEITIFACITVMIATLFVRPVWFLANKGRIKNWEHATAKVVDKQLSKIRYHHSTGYQVTLTLRFRDSMGKEYNESIIAPAFMRRVKEGVEFKIAFDPKHPDRLIVSDTARKQVITMTVTGIILEVLIITLSIIAFVLDQ